MAGLRPAILIGTKAFSVGFLRAMCVTPSCVVVVFWWTLFSVPCQGVVVEFECCGNEWTNLTLRMVVYNTLPSVGGVVS